MEVVSGQVVLIENLLVSYRKENPPNPKIGQTSTLTSEFTLQQEIGKYPENTRKIPLKYEFRIFSAFRGVSEGVFRGVSFLYVGGYFWFSGFSYSVAGRWVLVVLTDSEQSLGRPTFAAWNKSETARIRQIINVGQVVFNNAHRWGAHDSVWCHRQQQRSDNSLTMPRLPPLPWSALSCRLLGARSKETHPPKQGLIISVEPFKRLGRKGDYSCVNSEHLNCETNTQLFRPNLANYLAKFNPMFSWDFQEWTKWPGPV